MPDANFIEPLGPAFLHVLDVSTPQATVPNKAADLYQDGNAIAGGTTDAFGRIALGLLPRGFYECRVIDGRGIANVFQLDYESSRSSSVQIYVSGHAGTGDFSLAVTVTGSNLPAGELPSNAIVMLDDYDDVIGTLDTGGPPSGTSVIFSSPTVKSVIVTATATGYTPASRATTINNNAITIRLSPARVTDGIAVVIFQLVGGIVRPGAAYSPGGVWPPVTAYIGDMSDPPTQGLGGAFNLNGMLTVSLNEDEEYSIAVCSPRLSYIGDLGTFIAHDRATHTLEMVQADPPANVGEWVLKVRVVHNLHHDDNTTTEIEVAADVWLQTSVDAAANAADTFAAGTPGTPGTPCTLSTAGPPDHDSVYLFVRPYGGYMSTMTSMVVVDSFHDKALGGTVPITTIAVDKTNTGPGNTTDANPTEMADRVLRVTADSFANEPPVTPLTVMRFYNDGACGAQNLIAGPLSLDASGCLAVMVTNPVYIMGSDPSGLWGPEVITFLSPPTP